MKVIGIDIGGTKTIIGIIDITKGKVIKKISISSKQFQNDKENLKSIVSNTIDIIGKLKINKIGIGVPELIDNKGIIRGDYNFNWLNKNLADNFPKKFKVIVDSDVRCHLRAEKLYGHGKNAKNFIYINIGTGLSYAHFKNNEIYSGANGFAIHFASSKITLFDPKRNKKISLIPEDFYSGKFIMTYFKKNKNIKKQKVILENIADSLGSLIGNLINTVDPGFIVLGGGVVLNNIEFRKMLINYSHNYIFFKDIKKIKILVSKLKIDTGVLGAAAIFK
ncbi:MAG: ROK family protein [Pelagibacteraceae bacterium]|nr:ROK family protein [Pelagibacteraceae bacterium]MBT3902686.1 ROK family protein [Pelagibacteraceae bacterium]MBT4952103.1 ROK family protein [Pelagibacteraceae bacterium]